LGDSGHRAADHLYHVILDHCYRRASTLWMAAWVLTQTVVLPQSSKDHFDRRSVLMVISMLSLLLTRDRDTYYCPHPEW